MTYTEKQRQHAHRKPWPAAKNAPRAPMQAPVALRGNLAGWWSVRLNCGLRCAVKATRSGCIVDYPYNLRYCVAPRRLKGKPARVLWGSCYASPPCSTSR